MKQAVEVTGGAVIPDLFNSEHTNMNDTNVANNQAAVAKINTDELESAICDMEVALALTDAIDNFMDRVRGWQPDNEMPSEIRNAQVLLSELADRLRKADKSLFNALQQVTGRAA